MRFSLFAVPPMTFGQEKHVVANQIHAGPAGFADSRTKLRRLLAAMSLALAVGLHAAAIRVLVGALYVRREYPSEGLSLQQRRPLLLFISVMTLWLPAVRYPEAGPGYWDPVTSTLNWCEEVCFDHAV
jgi:hypothetical protein